MPAGLKASVQQLKDKFIFYVLNATEETPDGAKELFVDAQDYMMKVIAVPKGGSTTRTKEPKTLCQV